jgi:hypothetical protein
MIAISIVIALGGYYTDAINGRCPGYVDILDLPGLPMRPGALGWCLQPVRRRSLGSVAQGPEDLDPRAVLEKCGWNFYLQIPCC